MKHMMGIFDTDPAYAEKLAERLCEREDFPYWVFLFLRKEELVSYTEGHHLHLLLVASSLADEEIRSLPADRILILSEDDDQEKACKEYSDPGSFAMADPYQPDIKRYQSVSDFVREVNEKLEVEKGEIVKREGVRILGIFSPTPLPERDRVIREVLSSEKEKKGNSGNKSFLITLASFSELAPKEDENRYDISDAYYFWKQNKLKEHLPDLVCSGEDFDYIPGVYFPEDLLVISRDRIRMFLKDLADFSGCSEIFIDFASLGSDVSLIRSLCDEQIMPYYDRTESRGRITSYERYVSQSGHGDWLERIIPYHLQDC